jgi:hypothetical protein
VCVCVLAWEKERERERERKYKQSILRGKVEWLKATNVDITPGKVLRQKERQAGLVKYCYQL